MLKDHTRHLGAAKKEHFGSNSKKGLPLRKSEGPFLDVKPPYEFNPEAPFRRLKHLDGTSNYVF